MSRSAVTRGRRQATDRTIRGQPRSYVIYGPTPWGGALNAAHNIAHALAARHEVLYIDPPLSPLSPIRYGLGSSTWPRAKAVLDRRLRSTGRLRTFSPLVLPPIEHAKMRALSTPLLRAQISRTVTRAGLHEPVLLDWRGLPECSGAAGEVGRVGVIMDHPSGAAALSGRSAADVEAEAAAHCASCDFICTTSHAMQRLLAERGWESELVPFAFPSDLVGAFDGAVEPAEYRSLPRPLLGYTGGIDDRLDFDLIVKLADRFEHGSLVFVGHLSPRLTAEARDALASRKNIHLLGPRSRDQLPGYVRYLDVALMPYQDTLFTRHQSPMKAWEYFYAGPPIVGVACPELRFYPSPLVNYAEEPGAVPSLVELALASPGAGVQERRRFALANTWEDRAAQLDAAVAERIGDAPVKAGAVYPAEALAARTRAAQP